MEFAKERRQHLIWFLCKVVGTIFFRFTLRHQDEWQEDVFRFYSGIRKVNRTVGFRGKMW